MLALLLHSKSWINYFHLSLRAKDTTARMNLVSLLRITECLSRVLGSGTRLMQLLGAIPWGQSCHFLSWVFPQNTRSLPWSLVPRRQQEVREHMLGVRLPEPGAWMQSNQESAGSPLYVLWVLVPVQCVCERTRKNLVDDGAVLWWFSLFLILACPTRFLSKIK